MVNVPQVLFFIMISASLFMSRVSIFFFFSCGQRSPPLFLSWSKKKKQSRHIMHEVLCVQLCVCPPPFTPNVHVWRHEGGGKIPRLAVFFFQSPFARVQSVSERREFDFWSAAGFFFGVFVSRAPSSTKACRVRGESPLFPTEPVVL